MKRKTNIFYTDGPDSKFLTFSNYTESLTGNFLSTDTKLYPSMFLCLNVNNIIDENNKIIENNKKDFINNYLTGYYENKLAVLRDYFIENDQKPEDYMSPLGYLLDTIKKFDPNFTITYVGDITEQDYNGTYTDTICTISFANYYKGTCSSETQSELDNNYVEYSENSLYGWKENELTNIIENIQLNFDKDNNKYCIESNINKLIIEKNINDNSINFNVIIPLFDVTNINYHTQHYITENIESITNNYEINLNNSDLYRKYVPLGIWFADETITLKKDSNNIFSQSWSLLISSQFKPFPYSNASINGINENSVSNAYPTFAMILSRQNEILNQFSEISKLINQQTERISTLETKINNMSTSSNIDKINNELIKFENTTNNKINALKQEMKEFMNNFIWNAAQ